MCAVPTPTPISQPLAVPVSLILKQEEQIKHFFEGFGASQVALVVKNLPRCPSADEWIRKLWDIYTMEYYSAIKKNTFESVIMRWMKLEPIIQSEVSQKEKHHYSILMHIYGI